MLSQLGDRAFVVALGWRAYTLSGSTALGVVLMLQAVGLLATLLLGGALADRWSRRGLMIAADVVRAGVVAALAAAELAGATSVALLGVTSLLVGLGGGFFEPAWRGLLPLVVSGEQLASANALVGLSRRGGLVLGPALAGLAYEPAGPGFVFALDAATYVVSAGLVALTRPQPQARAGPSSALQQILEGGRYVASVPWLWVTLLLFTVYVMVALAPLQVLLPALVEQEFDRGVGAYGLVFVAQGLGLAIGGLGYAHVLPQRRRGVTTYLCWTASSLAIVALALAPVYAAALVAAVGYGLVFGFAVSMWNTMLMQLVPGALLSRVASIDFFVSLGLMPVGLIGAGVLATVAPPQLLLTAGGLLSAALFATCLRMQWLRAVQ